MKGATAVPWLKIISPPNNTNNKSKIIIGKSQYFFLVDKKSKISFKKFITKTVFSYNFKTIIFLNIAKTNPTP